ncbi:hypothetical protein Tco_0734350 [Tanacetum coccineum]
MLVSPTLCGYVIVWIRYQESWIGDNIPIHDCERYEGVEVNKVARETIRMALEVLILFREHYEGVEGSIMGEVDINTLTMEQYVALTQGNQARGVLKPEIGGNVNFKIKSQFMRELRKDTFSMNKNDDAHEHVEQVLDIVSLFNIPGVSHDAVMLRVFPFTLTGAAKRYCPPSKTAKQLEEIRNFKKEAIQTMVDHSQKWHDGSSSRNVSSNSNSEGIAAIISKLDSLGRDMKKLKENVHAFQVGCQTCGGAHLDKECPLNKEVKGVEEVKYGEFRRPFNGGNRAKYRVGLLGYYTRVDNRPPFGEKKASLRGTYEQAH